MATSRNLHPLIVMLLWLAAAFVVIGLGPMLLFPSTNSFVRVEAMLWKLFGAGLLSSRSTARANATAFAAQTWAVSLFRRQPVACWNGTWQNGD